MLYNTVVIIIIELEKNMDLHEKLKKLNENLKDMGSLAVAFSGGVDSTFLIKVAYEVLKDKVIAVTARSSTYPEREFKEAVDFINKLGAKHIVIVLMDSSLVF